MSLFSILASKSIKASISFLFEAKDAALRVGGWFARDEVGERVYARVLTVEGRRRVRDEAAASIFCGSEDTIPSEAQRV